MRGIFAAWFMFLRDKRAASLLDNSFVGAVKSYWAALFVLPLYMLGTTIEFLAPSEDMRNFGYMVSEAGLLNATIAELCIFVLCWFVAWPLVLDRIASYLDCEDNFFRYIAGYNWMRVIYVLIGLVYVTLNFAGVIPKESQTAAAFTLLAMLWTYHWFVLRHALGVNGGYAALLVAAEFLFVSMVRDLVLVTAF